MPPKEWYEKLKALFKDSKALKSDSACFYLRGRSDEPLIDLRDAYGGADINKLNDEQIKRLYDVSKTTGIVVPDLEGENFKVIYSGENDEPKFTQSSEDQIHEDYPAPIQETVTKYKEMPSNKKVKAQQIRDLEIVPKTIAEMYKGPDGGQGPDLDAILASENIVNKEGIPLKREENPWHNYTKIYNTINADGEIYFQGILDRNTNKEVAYKIVKNSEGNLIPERQQDAIIRKDIKDDAIGLLESLQENILNTKTKNPRFKEIQDGIKKTIDELKETNGKEAFINKMNEIVKPAEDYYLQKAGVKMRAVNRKKVDYAEQLKNIRDAVANDYAPSDVQIDPFESKQKQIAARYIRAYCTATMKYSTDPEQIRKAQTYLSDPKAFDDRIKETLKKDQAFLYLYGSRQPGDEKDTLKRIEDGLSTRHSKLLKKIENERKHPTPERLEAKAFLQKQAVTRVEKLGDQNGRLPLTRHAEIRKALEQIRKDMNSIGGANMASAEFQELEKELAITTMRLANGNSSMDVKLQMAKLGDAADKYLSHANASIYRRRRFNRMELAHQIREVCGAVEEDKPVAPEVKHGNELKRETVASKMTQRMAQKLIDSGDPAAMKRGKNMMLEPKIFEAEKKTLMRSEGFKKKYGGEAVINEKELEKEPDEALKEVLQIEKEKNPVLKKGGPVSEKQKDEIVKEEVKLDEPKKEKEKEKVAGM